MRMRWLIKKEKKHYNYQLLAECKKELIYGNFLKLQLLRIGLFLLLSICTLQVRFDGSPASYRALAFYVIGTYLLFFWHLHDRKKSRIMMCDLDNTDPETSPVTDMLRKGNNYLTETDDTFFFLDLDQTLPQGAKRKICLPETITAEQESVIRASVFYQQMQKMQREKGKCGEEAPDLQKRVKLAAEEVIDIQVRAGNMEFFLTNEPFRYLEKE